LHPGLYRALAALHRPDRGASRCLRSALTRHGVGQLPTRSPLPEVAVGRARVRLPDGQWPTVSGHANARRGVLLLAFPGDRRGGVRRVSVSAERRLAKLETALSPTELVIRWLDEALGFGSLDAYTNHLLETDRAEGPLDRLCRETEANARQSARGRPRQALD